MGIGGGGRVRGGGDGHCLKTGGVIRLVGLSPYRTQTPCKSKQTRAHARRLH